MDCRNSLILGLAMGVLGGLTGCTPSWFSKKNTTDPTQNLVKENPKIPLADPPTKKVAKEKELPKRAPEAMTCVAFGNFRLRVSKEASRTPEMQRELREQAQKAFQQALKIDPNCIEAYRGLAELFQDEKDEARAIAVYQSAVQVAPKNAALWYELGMMHSRRKEWKLATDALTNAVELNPDHRQYANILGHCLARSGQFEQALAYFTQVVGEARAHYNVGRMMVHVGQTDPGKKMLQIACEKDPQMTEARDLLAELDKGKTEAKKAIVPVQYAEEKQP